MSKKQHWESVYGNKAPESVSWYAPHLQESLRYIRQAAPDKNLAILDVGGGESTLVDDLVHAGYRDITVLDISATALDVTRRRLGADGAYVKWIAADILDVELPLSSYEIWHDRAVFHFLTDDDQRRRYIAQVLKALKPGGFAIVGTFGPEGPEKCSGLQVSRYSPSELHDTFGNPFELLGSSIEEHTTPWGSPQQFVYCFCRRAAAM
jgi:SAM-dependent methyltransferase